ncbi:ADP-ribosylglycohydrolase family protein [Candidatus Woesearchaeota archaeon]|nr:ADP-ribosylglycohydrolase family protein [Candidatus Woesearchaeota archaeon]
MTKDRFIGTLVGCATGDALGMPVEGWKREQIQKYVGKIIEPLAPVMVRDAQGQMVKADEFGKLRYFTKDFARGEYTDDTILTLALAESIASRQGLDLEDVAKRQLQAYEIRRKPDGRVHGGFGRTTMQGFENLRKSISPLHSGVVGSPGNAPAMKMAPVGLYMHATGEYAEGLGFAAQVARVTHLDPRSVVSGVVQAHAVYVLLQNIARQDFLNSLVEVGMLHEKPVTADCTLADAGSLTERLVWIQEHPDRSPDHAFRQLGNSGCVFESYPFALFLFQRYWNDPIEGLLETVNFGGDCDTTGAIYGALCGARCGTVFPQTWIRALKGLDKLVAVAEELYKLTSVKT